MSLTAEQQTNANAIIAAGQARGESRDNITIAVMTALTESGLRNLSYGDRDSVGLFQQRTPWGSFATRTNPTASANLFYDRLDKVPQGLDPWMRAQKVQISAFSDGSNYKAQYQLAQQITSNVTAASASPTANTVGMVSTTSDFSTLLSNVSEASFWIRLGLGTLGAVLLSIAAIKLLDANGIDIPKGLTNAGS